MTINIVNFNSVLSSSQAETLPLNSVVNATSFPQSTKRFRVGSYIVPTNQNYSINLISIKSFYASMTDNSVVTPFTNRRVGVIKGFLNGNQIYEAQVVDQQVLGPLVDNKATYKVAVEAFDGLIFNAGDVIEIKLAANSGAPNSGFCNSRISSSVYGQLAGPTTFISFTQTNISPSVTEDTLVTSLTIPVGGYTIKSVDIVAEANDVLPAYVTVIAANNIIWEGPIMDSIQDTVPGVINIPLDFGVSFGPKTTIEVYSDTLSAIGQHVDVSVFGTLTPASESSHVFIGF